MKQSFRLSLKREALAELATDDLGLIQGAAAALSNAQTRCTLDRSYLIGCSNTITCQTTYNTCDC